MKCSRRHVLVEVVIPPDLSCDGTTYRKKMQIDACIADLVEALDRAGIATRGCCCGHGEHEGHIQLQDGRVLLVLQGPSAERYLAREPYPLFPEKWEPRCSPRPDGRSTQCCAGIA
jgi:hypothetical protein